MKILLFILSFVLSSYSMACDCIIHPDDVKAAVDHKLNISASVVLAEVESIKKIKIRDKWWEKGNNGEETHFSVIQSWKGDHGNYFSTKIITDCCVCGIQFEKGKKYLLYLHKSKDKGYYSTSSCSGNKEFEAAQKEIQYLNSLSL